MKNGSFADEFSGSAALFVQLLDIAQDRLLITVLSEADYRRSSFLDQRILTPERPRQWVKWDDLAELTGLPPGDAQFIFHVGHVGSTLVSRLLGELPTVLAVREPLLLRAFAEVSRIRHRPESPWPPDDFNARLDVALSWLSRSFRRGQRAVVKATSFVNEVAPQILSPGRKALFIGTRAQTYLETIMAGEASLQELAAMSGSRLARLHDRLGDEAWRLWRLSTGERAAMAWACETSALEQAFEASEPADICWLDFDAFLDAPAEQLVRAASHLGHALDAQGAASLVDGPIMRTYSKAPEHPYSPALRRQVLAGARRDHREELRRGQAWLEEAARRHPLIARAVARAGG